MLTGEPAPAEVAPGDPVTGGCVNAGGHLVVRAGRVGADTQLAQLARLVAPAQAGKAPVQRLADRISAVFVPAVLGLAAATLTGWLTAGAVAAGARERFGGLPSAEGFASAQGLGVSGVVDGRVVVAGRAAWLSSAWGWPVPDGLAARVAAAEAAGRTVVFAGWDGAVRGAL